MARTTRRGLTLVELMVVIAIIVILIALSGSMLQRLVLRSRLKEATIMLDASRSSLIHADLEERVDLGGFWPRDQPDKNLHDASSLPVGACFDKPDGNLRCSYSCTTDDADENVVHVFALCNLDGDADYLLLVQTIDFSRGNAWTTDGLAGYRATSPLSTAAAALAAVKSGGLDGPYTAGEIDTNGPY